MVELSQTPALPPGEVALFLDVDGTLIDIAPRPDAVVVPDDLRRALAALDVRLGGALALVSGRAIADLDTLFHPLHLRASGVHGAEIRTEPTATPIAQAGDKLPALVNAAVHGVAADHRGTLVEDKGFSIAVHYRANPDAGPALREGLARVVDGNDGLQILPGHMVFEVKRAAFNKGLAITRFMQAPPFAGRRPIFIGDDVTDLPGFETVLAMGGLAFSVTMARAGLSGHFEAPSEVRAWISALARHDAGSSQDQRHDA